MVQVDEKKLSETVVTEEEIKKIFNQGYRNFIAGDYTEAADSLQEVCRWNAEKYGEKDDKCAEGLLLYGRCLLELGRAENCVLGNALKGWSQLEYDSQENITAEDQFEDPEKVSPDDRAKLREEVTAAMAEPDTIEEETEKTDNETGKTETTDEPMSTDAAEPKVEEKTEEKKEEKPDEKKEEKKEETMETDAAQEKPTEQDSMAEDPDSIPSLQLAWEMIELARIIYKQRAESMESDIKISECYLRLGEIGMEIENYAGAVGDFLECQVLQKKHFQGLDRRIAETHYHLGAAYSFQKRHESAKEHFQKARKIILDKIDELTTKFDDETEKESEAKVLNDLTNEIAQLKEILPDLNSKLEDIETSLKADTFEKVSEHLTKEKAETGEKKGSNIQHLVKRKQEELEKMEAQSPQKKTKTASA